MLIKSVLLMAAICSFPVVLGLIFGGKIIPGYKNERALFIMVGVLAAAMVAGAIILIVKT